MLAILTGQLQNEKAIEHSENEVITYFETRLDLECSIPAFNNHAPGKKTKQPIQNQVNTIQYRIKSAQSFLATLI